MSLDQPLTVEELLNYRLSRLVALTSVPGIRLLEGRFGVSRRAWGLMGLIASHGAMSPSELAARSHLERAKVSLGITELVNRGLLERVVMANDRRRARIDVTPRGRELYEQAFPLLAELSRSMLQDLSREQITALDDIIRTLSAAAERVNASVPVAAKADRRRGRSRSRNIEMDPPGKHR
ncbi:MAG: MarR family transcriptional regulator [Rhizobacter sp.]|nr:MarR family transcriptional regulator [Rhizobacter sp.]